MTDKGSTQPQDMGESDTEEAWAQYTQDMCIYMYMYINTQIYTSISGNKISTSHCNLVILPLLF